MKKISLSLMASVCILGLLSSGCSQDLGPLTPGEDPSESQGPVALTKKGGKPGGPGGGDPPGIPATLTLTVGMATTGFPVMIRSDDDKEIAFESHEPHAIRTNFLVPGDPFKMSKYLDPADEAALLAELAKSVTNGFFTVQIDKTSLTESGTTSEAMFVMDYDGDLGGTRIQMGGPYGTSVTAKCVSPDEFVFTGTVIVGTTGGGRKNSRVIGCPGVEPDPNKILMTLTR